MTVVFSTVDGNSLTIGTETGETDTGGNDGGGGLASQGAPSESAGRASRTTPSTSPTAGGDDGGGAILDEGGDGNVYLSSTISGNSVDDLAGQHRQWRRRHLQLRQLADQQPHDRGQRHPTLPAARSSTGAQSSSRDTIVAGNTATPAGNCAGNGTLQSAGFNLENANTCGFNAGGDLVNTDPQSRTAPEQRWTDADAGIAGGEPGCRRRLVYRHRTTAADDRPARRRAAAAGGWEVRHRRVRVDPRGTTAAASTTVKARDGSGQAGRDQHHRGELLEHGQPRGPDDDGRLPIRDRCALPPRRRLGHRL